MDVKNIEFKMNKSKDAELEVENFLIASKINYEKNTQVIGKFRPDFFLNDFNICIEVKYIDDLKSRLALYERNSIAKAVLSMNVLEKIYRKKFKSILIIKRESGKYYPTNVLYSNMLFDLFLPIEYIHLLNTFLQENNKNKIFFKIMDELFEKDWKKKKSSFPSVVYHFLLTVEKKQYLTVSEFIKSENYSKSNKFQIFLYLNRLEYLKIIKKEKISREVNIYIENDKWRYFVYLIILSKGNFGLSKLNYIESIWTSILENI